MDPEHGGILLTKYDLLLVSHTQWRRAELHVHEILMCLATHSNTLGYPSTDTSTNTSEYPIGILHPLAKGQPILCLGTAAATGGKVTHQRAEVWQRDGWEERCPNSRNMDSQLGFLKDWNLSKIVIVSQ